jgi:glycosyltransferase involved in cell wall biosynthesis
MPNMKIAIHCSDLDHSRIDGTRVYILNLLRQFGKLDTENKFELLHRSEFNPELEPPKFANYYVKKIAAPLMWTQIGFAWGIFTAKPEVVWMPMANVPLLRRRNTKVVVTIHDLAFKHFPQYFTKKDLRKLNFFSKLAINKSDHIIAISNATKRDILNFFPHIKPEKISVVYHGFTSELFERNITEKQNEVVLSKFNLKKNEYLLYVGAIQPRKDLVTLVLAFEQLAKTNLKLKLVIGGDKAWQWEETFNRIEESPVKERIIVTGKLQFEDVSVLYRNAAVFVFPELYAGFGIPLLEAMASGVPVVSANNSSLIEAGGEAAIYFESGNVYELATKIESILANETLRLQMIENGREHVKDFSWEKCAKHTLDILTKR